MLLETIHTPADLKALSNEQLSVLCQEIRETLMQVVSKNGGHLASNLGTVELTVAMHYVFDSPLDQFIFDVGHQCYTHKLLTGRYEQFASLRTEGGVSGFTRPSESIHDVFVSGHSSTSISAGLGLSVANALQKQPYYTVAVIGDGALTGGLAYEALNNAGRMKRNKLIVILNDNKMSISRNVGAMARHLAVIRSRPGYMWLKTGVARFLLHVPLIGKWLHRTVFKLKTLLKNWIYQSTIFEELGFAYFGPIDGHNLRKLQDCMEMAKHSDRPALIHVCTCKGKGYPFAEKTPKDYHGVSSGMDLDSGECPPPTDSFSHIFGQTLCTLAAHNPSICAVTAAMCDGTGLTDFAKQFPDRFFDVGIAEEHALTFASGLAKGGMLPIVAVYSSFLQRGYDQLVHDIAAQNVKVIVCVDRAGFVGEDGEMHQGLLDAAFLRTVPGAVVYAPCNFLQLQQTLAKAVEEKDSLIAIRYPKGNEPTALKGRAFPLTFGIAVDQNATIALVTYGRVTGACVEAAETLTACCKVDVITINQIKPLPNDLFSLLCTYKKLYFFEEGNELGGVSQEILATLCKMGYNGTVQIAAVGDTFVSHASMGRLLTKYGLSAQAIEQYIIKNEELPYAGACTTGYSND